jgi:hypothetical protein
MQTQWASLLAMEKAAQRGGIMWPEAIVRGLPFTMVLPFPLDVTADNFKLAFGGTPDAAALVTLTEGSGITVGSFADGETQVTCRLSDTQVGTIGTAQTDSDGDGLAEVLAEMLWQQGGTGDWRRAFLVSIPISGKIADD